MYQVIVYFRDEQAMFFITETEKRLQALLAGQTSKPNCIGFSVMKRIDHHDTLLHSVTNPKE